MPVYEYACDPCRVIYETRQSIRDAPLEQCPRCGGAVTRRFSVPNVNLKNYSGPTEAKYAKMSVREEIAREQILQKDFERIWLPPPVKHSPWEE